MKICPKCHHKQTEQSKEFNPKACPACGCLYAARDIINAEKRRENVALKPWRITRWRPKKKSVGMILGVPSVMVVMFVVYQIGQYIIAYSRPISNELYSFVQPEKSVSYEGKITRSTRNATIVTPQAVAPQPPAIQPDQKASVLTITSKKTVSLWLENQITRKKIGPYLIPRDKPKRIPLEKGKYTVKIINDGKLKISEITFAQQEGRLSL